MAAAARDYIHVLKFLKRMPGAQSNGQCRNALHLKPSVDGTNCVFLTELCDRYMAGHGPLRQRVALTILAGLLVVTASWAVWHFRGAAELAEKRGAVVSTALAVVEAHAVGLPADRWPSIRDQARAAAAKVDSDEAVYAVIRDVLTTLDDGRHSFAMAPDQWKRVKTTVTESAAERERRSPDHVRLLALPGRAARVLVVDVPPHAAMDSEAGMLLSKRLAKQIYLAAAARPCAIVVDLRRTGGGNMWPSLTALRSVTDPHHFGGTVDRHEQPLPSYRRLAEQQLGADLGDESLPMGALAQYPLAILIGPGTVSASEAIAAFLRMRPDSVLVGQPTAGLTTTNQKFDLPDGGVLILATRRLADANWKGYRGAMRPDIAASSDADGIEQAMKWAIGFPGCNP